MLRALTRQSHIEIIKRLADRVREIVATDSIYKGKAIRLNTNSEGGIDWNAPPTFLDVSKVKLENLIFSDSLMRDLDANVFNFIVNAEHLRKARVPLKRGVLLAGAYGTGKTLTAEAVAHLCEKHGLTYIVINRVSALQSGMECAMQLKRQCVLFCEDIDRELAGERTAEMDDILNVIDGVSSKSSEVMVIMTSNHAEKITKPMLRPGRLDVVLKFGPPDAKAAERLVRLYAGRLISKDTALTKTAEAVAGMIPATIREVVERAKLYAIADRPGMPFELSDSDLVASVGTLRYHQELMREQVDNEPSAAERMATGLAEVIDEHLNNGSLTGQRLKRIHETVENIEANQ
jgi:transitional endoplasmic reticulum ATPase